MKPTRIYVKVVKPLLKNFEINGMAHITGGGLLENMPRILPPSCQAVLHSGTWKIPPIFSLLQQWGSVPREEMWRVFNNGVGLVLVGFRRSGDGDLENPCRIGGRRVPHR